MSLSLGSGSTTSLSQKDLSQEDELSSTTSGQSSVDLHPPDDSERLSMLTAAVSWIKGELAAMRDCDRGILQQLLVAHSAITDLREQQGLNESQDTENTSKDYTLDDIQEDFESSGGGHGARSYKKEATPTMDTPLNGIANSTPLRDRSTTDDDDILRQFFGNDDITKLGYLKSSSSNKINLEEEGVDSSSTSRRGSEQDKLATSSGSNKDIAELKLEAKKEGRSSVAFEMQLFRQQLQEQARSELAAFDKEFDRNTDLSTLLEPEARSYRHSILNRMDELLYPSQNNRQTNGSPRSHRSGSHIRQSSEPVVFNDMRPLDGSLVQRGTSARSDGKSHFPSSQSTHFTSPNGRKASEPAHNSFRMPTSRTYVELSRSGSGFLSNKHRPDAPHYDTTVVKRKSSSSRNSTLEKSASKQSLQYSVESLDREDFTNPLSSPHSYDGRMDSDLLLRDFESPEHKSVSGGGGGGGYYRQTERGVKVNSPEVYPEMSPRSKMVSPPYLQSQTNQQIRWNNSGRKKGGPPVTSNKKNFVRGNSENSWL